MTLLLLYLIACGAVLNGVLLWYAYCWAIGFALDVMRFKA